MSRGSQELQFAPHVVQHLADTLLLSWPGNIAPWDRNDCSGIGSGQLSPHKPTSSAERGPRKMDFPILH